MPIILPLSEIKARLLNYPITNSSKVYVPEWRVVVIVMYLTIFSIEPRYNSSVGRAIYQ